MTEDHRLTTLPGGVRVISEALPSVRSVAIGCWIGAGSRNKRAAQGGISHFIEHLLFRGSKRFTALDIAQTFDGLGGELNAETSKEYTLVHARVLDSHVEIALELMGDMLRAPTFSDLPAEREVVLEEIAMYADTPDDLVHDLVAAAVFGDPSRSAGRSSAASSRSPRSGCRTSPGTTDEVRRPQRGRRGGRQRPARALVELVGTPGGCRGDRAEPQRTSGPAPVRAALFREKDTEQYHVCLGAPGVSRADDRRFAAALLDALLGGTASSRLFQEIREKRGMAYSVYSYGSHYGETGQVGVYLGTRGENVATCLQLIREQAEQLAEGRIPTPSCAGEGAPEGPDHALDGVDLGTHVAAREVAPDEGRDPLSGRDRLPHRRGHARRVAPLAGELYGAGRLAAAGVGQDAARFDAALAAAALQPRAA